MKLIVGLGNPGEKYTNTRHNVGFAALDRISEKWSEEPSFSSIGREKNTEYESEEFEWIFSEAEIKEKIVLLKPLTFMNLSGEVVRSYLKYAKKIDIATDLWVVHDDLDISLGKVKIDHGASSAGHNGVQNIIDQLGTKDFIRFRIGIKPTVGFGEPTDKFVLKKFLKEEYTIINGALDDVVNGAYLTLVHGVEKARSLHGHSSKPNCC